MNCTICGRPVTSGVVLHTHCLEQLQPVWHPGDEKPPTHIEIIYDEDGMVDYWKQAKMNRLAHRMEGNK